MRGCKPAAARINWPPCFVFTSSLNGSLSLNYVSTSREESEIVWQCSRGGSVEEEEEEEKEEEGGSTRAAQSPLLAVRSRDERA